MKIKPRAGLGLPACFGPDKKSTLKSPILGTSWGTYFLR